MPAYLRRPQFWDRLADFYGPGRSLTIWRDGRDQLVPPSDIVVADPTD